MSNQNVRSMNNAESVEQKIQKIIEQDKLYLDKTFGYSTIFDAIGLNENKLDGILFEMYGKSLWTLILELRVKELKKRICELGKSTDLKQLFPSLGFQSQKEMELSFYAIENAFLKDFISSVCKSKSNELLEA